MSRSSQRGVGATVIIAILVILAALGAALVTSITSQQSALALDVLAARTYQSARAGLEYGIHHVLRGTMTCAAVDAANLTMTGSHAGIIVTLDCSASTHTEGATTVTMSTITATACTATAGTCPQAATTPHYVERQLRVSIGSD
jgi:MSHA biogenesis protein MshP